MESGWDTYRNVREWYVIEKADVLRAIMNEYLHQAESRQLRVLPGNFCDLKTQCEAHGL